MTKPNLPKTASRKSANSSQSLNEGKNLKKRKVPRRNENSNVLISAVLSSYLLTHLHHVLQRAEYAATREGRISQAGNYAQLRKVLCMDARSMQDASALGLKESDLDNYQDGLDQEHKAA